MSAYSFLNVAASISGPGLVAQIGSSSGAAKEGLSTAFDEDKTTITTGSDGAIMTSLRATMTGRITVRLLKTSPINAILSQAYNFQRLSSINWGQNAITVTDVARGDVVTGRQMAFVKFPDNGWAEDGNTLDWVFQGIINEILGAGVPDVNTP
jgi:Bacteriophage KPP10, Structural protein ORF10